MTYRGIRRNNVKFSSLRESIDGNDVKNRDIEIPMGGMVKRNGKCMGFSGSGFRIDSHPSFTIYQLCDLECMTEPF